MLRLNGKDASEAIIQELKEKTTARKKAGHRAPCLSAVLVGDDGASKTYVNHKIKACEQIGYRSMLHHLDESTSEDELLKLIDELNKNEEIDGYIVQLPLPPHINETRVLEAVDPKKDVDGFHPTNSGRMMKGLPCFISATPFGILKLLEHYQLKTEGLHAVVLGRSQIVGTPMSLLLSRNTQPGNCTVTLCHSRTRNLEEICQQADILVAALGKPGFVKKKMVKEGAIVIDVGTTRVDDPSAKRGWRLKGDVDYDAVKDKAKAISPVPGGVGPMTIAGLMYNTFLAAEGSMYTQD